MAHPHLLTHHAACPQESMDTELVTAQCEWMAGDLQAFEEGPWHKSLRPRQVEEEVWNRHHAVGSVKNKARSRILREQVRCCPCGTSTTCFQKESSENKGELLKMEHVRAKMKDSVSGLEGEAENVPSFHRQRQVAAMASALFRAVERRQWGERRTSLTQRSLVPGGRS